TFELVSLIPSSSVVGPGEALELTPCAQAVPASTKNESRIGRNLRMMTSSILGVGGSSPGAFRVEFEDHRAPRKATLGTTKTSEVRVPGSDGLDAEVRIGQRA